MIVLALVVGAAILLTWMLVHSYSWRDVPGTRRARAARASDGGDAWIFVGSDGGAGGCGADAGAGCGDGGGGGGD